VSDLRTALEASLVARPDDLATHMAYADFLHEQGDPRGELIQVQLALEDPTRTPEERKRLQQREKELLDAHLRDWLGEIAYVFLDETADNETNTFGLEYYRGSATNHFRLARGWLEYFEIDMLNTRFAQALPRCPMIRLLRELIIREIPYYDETETGEVFQTLADLPALDCVRLFTIGNPGDNCHITAFGSTPVIARMVRLEELFLYAHQVEVDEVFGLPMPNLRTLHAYHLHYYPLAVLANNPTLTNLVTLECYPHMHDPGDEGAYIQPQDFRALVLSPHLNSLTHLRINQSDVGDDEVRVIIESGILRRLRYLNLHNGRISDTGDHLLASCPDLRRLKHLDLSGNQLTEQGIAALRATGVKLIADKQFSAESIALGEHLWEGDME
jgi:uncharacterized protein (TIGR02996 family)